MRWKNPTWVPAGTPWTPAALGSRLVCAGSDAATIQAITAADRAQGMFAVVTPTAINASRTIFGASVDGGRQLRIDDGTTPTVNRQGVAAYAQGQASSVPLVVGQSAVVGAVLKSAAPLGRSWIRCQEVALNYGTSASFTASTTTINKQGSGAEAFAGTIGLAVFTSGALTNDEIARIQGWLAWQNSKAAVASLVDGFAWKNSAPSITE